MLLRFIGLLFLTLSLGVNAQFAAFDIDYDAGKINSVFVMEDKFVFEVHSTGVIKSIYLFHAEADALTFMQDPRPDLKPRKRLSLSGVNFYINSFTSIEYCKNYSNYSRAGIVGEVCSVDGLDIEYNLKIGNNSSMGIVGRIKKIGNIEIAYHKNYSSYVNAGITGKIASIGNMDFEYYSDTYSAGAANYIGAFKDINGVQIKYHQAYSTKSGHEGKLSQIGKVEFNYYKNYSSNQYSGIVGKFKSREGYDPRLFII